MESKRSVRNFYFFPLSAMLANFIGSRLSVVSTIYKPLAYMTNVFAVKNGINFVDY